MRIFEMREFRLPAAGVSASAISGQVLVLLLALAALGLTGCFKPSGEARALSECLSQCAGGRCQQEIAIGVGSVPFTLLRAGLAFVDLEPEARAALTTLRSAGVTVYHFRAGGRGPNRPALLAAADATMTERGWDRVVGVLSPEEMVAVYVPAELKSTRNVPVCVVVLDGRELVVASVRGNLQPLAELALAEVAKTKGDWRAPWAGRRESLGEFGAD